MLGAEWRAISLLAAVPVLLLGTQPSSQPLAAQNLVVNGSFEDDACTGSGLGFRLGLSGNDVNGWFIPDSDGSYPWCLQNVNAFGGGPAADGDQWLVLGRVSTGVEYSIQQALTGLTPGATYDMSFSLASEVGCCSVAELSFLSGSTSPAQQFLAPSSGSFWTEWISHSTSFIATASSVTFQFRDLSDATTGGIDLGLDAVRVVGRGPTTTVPEPSTVVLLATALMGVAGVARRRRTHFAA